MAERLNPPPRGIAILGCGYAAALHSRTLAHIAPSWPRHYASRDPLRARAYTDRFDGRGCFSSYDEAVSDDGIDLVLIATPPATHFDLARGALRNGKSVIVEKPAFLSVADCDTILEEARAVNRSVFVAENYAYKPLTTRLRRLIQDGTIGEPRFLFVNALKRQHSTGWRAEESLAGGGALFEGGIHWISFMAALGLQVEHIQGSQIGTDGRPDTGAVVVLRYSGGAVGVLAYSWDVPSRLGGVRLSRLYGSEGTIAFESNGLGGIVLAPRPRLLPPTLHDMLGYRAMLRDFLNAIDTSGEPRYTMGHARRDLRLIEEAYASMRSPSVATP